MTTKLINLNHYRSHLPKLWKDAQKNNVKYVVTVHARPVFEVIPFQGNQLDEILFVSDFHEVEKKEITLGMKTRVQKTMRKSKKDLLNI